MEPVLHVCAFEDNYIWLIRGQSANYTRSVIIVDPGDAQPVLEILDRQQWLPMAIFCTHHHGDHVGGVADLLRHFAIPVYGPAREKIAHVTRPVEDDDRFTVLDIHFRVLAIPGHTRGHVAYYGNDMLFCGDTLFSAGCGRLFEGSPEDMHNSLARLTALPPQTAVYCGHEYTQANLRFAAVVEPNNTDVRRHQAQVAALRARQLPTLPSTLELEKKINPFLRTHLPEVRAAVATHAHQKMLPDDVSIFAALRHWKDGFK